MSALDAFVTPDAVHVFTDGGQYDPALVALHSVFPKITNFELYNAVVGFVGPTYIKHALAISINAATPLPSYAVFAENFPDIVKASIKHWSKFGSPKSWGKFEMVLAGWSEETGPSAHHLCGHAKDGWPAFQYREVTRFRAPDDPSLISFEFNPDAPAASGLDLMRRQRDIKVGVHTATDPTNGGEGFHVVHGFCQHTYVDREGIHTKILERWPT